MRSSPGESSLPHTPDKNHLTIAPAAAGAGPAIVTRVHAIVVTFHPKRDKLISLLGAIGPQVERVVIVDNGSGEARQWLRELVPPGGELIPLDENVGVAAAHNIGIARARSSGSDAVLLLDQDSVPDGRMVAELTIALRQLQERGVRVAAVGPRQIDERSEAAVPFVRFGFLSNQHLTCEGSDLTTIECDHLITSGSLIPIGALDVVGDMEENLFVDNVDTEWCFRALAKGFRLYGVCSAVMKHGVGDTLVRNLIPLQHDIVVHSPLRLYYITRNHILLYGRSYVPTRWTVQDLPRLLFKAVVFATSVSPRLTNSLMITKGIRDGLLRKTGRYGL